MTIKLYDYWRSSASYRVRIALNLAKLPFETIPVDLLAKEHLSDEYLNINPQGLVPTLFIDDLKLTQSLSIIEYLCQTKRLNALPQEPIELARVRTLSYAIAMEIHPVCNLSVAAFAQENSGGKINMNQWMEKFIPKGLTAFEKLVNHPQAGTYCHGETITLADICLIPQLYNAKRWNIPLDDYPKICEIAENLTRVDAFTKASPEATQQI